MNVAGKECVVGADVSRWQGTIDWSQFPDSFAFVKATGGDGGLYTDGQYARNAADCGVPWGPYHFASAGQYNAVTEANHFCDVILSSPWALLGPERKLPPVLDWEPTVNVNGSGAWVLTFLHQVELRTGIRPIIYTGAYVALDRLDELKQFDLWLAAYTPQPIACAPWGYDWSIWQWSSTTHVPGIAGNVDRNYATVEWFNRATSGAQPAPTEEPLMVTAEDENKIRRIVAEELAKAGDPSPFWIGRDETTGGVYLVKGNIKHHLTSFAEVDAAAVAFSAQNRGDQALALSTLAEV